MKAFHFLAGALALAAAPLLAPPSWAGPPMRAREPADPFASAAAGQAAGPALKDWVADSAGFIAARKAGARAKAATDLATVFRPVAPCRLFDTRGFPAAMAVAGPFAPNSTTNIASAGKCGIPSTQPVGGLSVSISIQNLTPAAGGYIATQQQGTPVSAINTVLNTGAEWTGTTANIPIPNGSGNFSVFVANSQVHVIVDVNGYYQDLNSLDIGTQEMDIFGATAGDMLALVNTAAGSTLSVSNSTAANALDVTSNGGAAIVAAGGSTGVALQVASGSIRAVNAGVGTTGFASIHQVNTAGPFGSGGTVCSAIYPDYTVFDHPQSNNDPNAILIVTPRKSPTVSNDNSAFEVYYYASGLCSAQSAGKWLIRKLDGTTHVNTSQFNVLVFKP